MGCVEKWVCKIEKKSMFLSSNKKKFLHKFMQCFTGAIFGICYSIMLESISLSNTTCAKLLYQKLNHNQIHIIKCKQNN